MSSQGGFVVDKVALGQVFWVFRFPLPILIPSTTPYSSSTIQGWYNRPTSGRRTKWTQSHPIPRNWKTIKKLCNDDVTVYVTKWRWCTLVPVLDGVYLTKFLYVSPKPRTDRDNPGLEEQIIHVALCIGHLVSTSLISFTEWNTEATRLLPQRFLQALSLSLGRWLVRQTRNTYEGIHDICQATRANSGSPPPPFLGQKIRVSWSWTSYNEH
jgi:hypothetical protein